MTDKPSLSIVIPAYNEEDSLALVIPDVLEKCRQENWKVIIVNDGSRDTTSEILNNFASDPNLTVIHHKTNRGYGAAIKTGLAAVDTDYAVTFDADGQHDLNDINRVFETALTNKYDLVIGSRKNQSQSGLYRAVGKWIIRLITKILLQVKITDLNSGFKLYVSQLVKKYLYLTPDSMSFSDIIVLIFISEGHQVSECPISVHERKHGKSTISTKTAFETVYEIINIIMTFNPLKIFMPAAIIFILLGVGWGIPIILAGRGISTGSMMSIVIGIVLLFIGFLAEQLSQLRKDILRLRIDNESKTSK